MEDAIINYVKSLSPKQYKKFVMYFKGRKLVADDDEDGRYLINDANVSESDRAKIGRAIYGHLFDKIDFKKIVHGLEQ